MIETDRMKALLDGRGVEYEWYDGEITSHVRWLFQGEHVAVFLEDDEGETTFVMDVGDYTPEQAVDATLGRGECEMEKLERFDGADPAWRCLSCGHETCDDNPSYCPNCGKAVER